MTTLLITCIEWDTEGQTRAACRLPEAVIVLNAPDFDGTVDQNDEVYDKVATWLYQYYGFAGNSMCMDVLGATQNGTPRSSISSVGMWDIGYCTVLTYTGEP